MKTEMASHLGRYQIDAEIGRGAMGLVYLAHDPKIDRQVAIKTISLFTQEIEEEHEFRERFFIEARAAGRLSHPGIVTIFDVGEDPATREPYIVMEYVPGQPLNKILSGENRKLPLGPALQITQEVAEALNYAHAQGVVHRDIKPANILISLDGHPKIADFGVAKLNQGLMTIPGQILGSPAYMAPEQLSGEGTDPRSDLFSLGVILYSMLTGFRPFQGNSAATVSFKVVNQDPLPVTSFDSDLPAALDRLVSRAIAKDPSQRYQTGLEMAQEIQKVRERHGLLGPAAPSMLSIASPERTAAKNVATARFPTPLMPVAVQPSISKARPQNGRPATAAAISAKWVSFASKSVLKMLPSEIALTAAAVLVLAIAFIAFETVHLRKAGVVAVQVPIAQNPSPVAPVVPATNPTSDGDRLEKLIDDPQVDSPIAPEKDTLEVPKTHVKIIRKPPVKPEAKLPAYKDAGKLPAQVSATATSNPAAKMSGSVENIRVASATPPAAKITASMPSIKAVSATAPATATLQIQIAYPFAEVEASVWIDNQLTYDQKLFGESKKRALLFKKVEGHEISNVNVPAGEHKIHIRVQSISSQYDQSQTFVGKFSASGQNVLAVACDKRGNGLQITLR
jgi:eukaryotic-like serine/threonine-protein kinase